MRSLNGDRMSAEAAGEYLSCQATSGNDDGWNEFLRTRSRRIARSKALYGTEPTYDAQLARHRSLLYAMDIATPEEMTGCGDAFTAFTPEIGTLGAAGEAYCAREAARHYALDCLALHRWPLATWDDTDFAAEETGTWL